MCFLLSHHKPFYTENAYLLFSARKLDISLQHLTFIKVTGMPAELSVFIVSSPMCHHVSCHQIFSAKLLSTHCAAIRFLSCMDSPMNVQVAHMTERLSTNQATVRFFLRVSPHVPSQSVAASKLFTTHLTHEQFLTHVDSSVCG